MCDQLLQQAGYVYSQVPGQKAQDGAPLTTLTTPLSREGGVGLRFTGIPEIQHWVVEMGAAVAPFPWSLSSNITQEQPPPLL